MSEEIKGVLVKGWTMPSSCRSCIFLYTGIHESKCLVTFARLREEKSKRMKDCPLEEIRGEK